MARKYDHEYKVQAVKLAKEIIRAKREKREPVIVPMFSSHIARHTFCTRLCENDVNVKVIQTIMGLMLYNKN